MRFQPRDGLQARAAASHRYLKRWVNFAVGCGLLLFAANCASSGPSYSESETKSAVAPLDPAQGRIFLYRLSKFVGRAGMPAMVLNGQLIGHSENGGFLYVDRPPGDYVISTFLDMRGVSDVSQRFALHAGETVYVVLEAKTGGYALRIVPAAMGAIEIRETQMRGALAGATMAAAPAAPMRTPIPVLPPPPVAKPNPPPAQQPARAVVTALTPDEAERLLQARSPAAASGIYKMDDEATFNVLDSVYYNPETDQLSLVGHSDSKFQGPKVRYLQHLAVLLKNPAPEFSLDWTPESGPRLDRLFRLHLSSAQAESVTDKWGEIFDRSTHDITRAGRLLLPALGLTPIEGARPPGALGAEVAPMPHAVTVRVGNVLPGSAADLAGLRRGDVIVTFRGRSPISPLELSHRVNMAGAGESFNLTYQRSGQRQPASTRVTLQPARNPDVWTEGTRYDLLRLLYFNQQDFPAAFSIDVIGMMDRAKRTGSSDEINTELRGLLINSLGLRGAVNADLAAIENGTMTEVAAFRDIYLKICQGLDKVFHLPGSPVADAYLQASRQRGGDPSSGLNPAMDEFSRQMEPKVLELLDSIFARPEGIMIPPELVEEQFQIHPEMTPRYLNLPADSLLAQTMYGADYLCKRLMNRPALKQKIPGYQTGFEFEVHHPEFRHTTGTYRIWISPDHLNTPQSREGTTLAVRDVTLRFNIREQDASGHESPNRPGSYEELLTRQWDAFEQEYPTLHELRETEKLAAAARWILQHNPKASLPESGRVHWNGLDRAPGLVFMEMTPDATVATKTKVTIIAEGGVSEAPPAEIAADPFPYDTSVVDLRNSSLVAPASIGETVTVSTEDAGPTAWTAKTDANGKPAGAIVLNGVFGSKVVKADFAAGAMPSSAPSETAAPSAAPRPHTVSGNSAPTGSRSGSASEAPVATANGATPQVTGELPGAKVVSSTFGAKVVQPNVGPAVERGRPGDDTKAADQLVFAADMAKAGGDLTRPYDTAGSRTGTLPVVHANPEVFSEAVKKDPRMAPLLDQMRVLQTRREELNAIRDDLTLRRNTTKDPEEAKQLTTELEQRNAEYQSNLVEMANEKDAIDKAKREIDTTEEPASTPAVSAPEASTAPAVPSPSQPSRPNENKF